MKTKALLILLLMSALSMEGYSRTGSSPEKTVTFRFVPRDDMFYIPWGGNDTELGRLHSLVDEYRSKITSGEMPIYVDGYCASLPTYKENINTAFIRANRVKSELIMHKDLRESYFVTRNYAAAYESSDGKAYRDMVIVTLRIPVKREEPQPQPVEPEPKVVKEAEPVAQTEPVTEAQPEPQSAPVQSPSWRRDPYVLAVRTNLLYDAFLVPSLGIEWRANKNIGIKVDGSFSYWGDEYGKVQKTWLVSPEVRWYMLDKKRFYVGAGANFGEYNVYEYPVGSLFPDDTGYQGKLWNAGVTVGYQLYLSRSFSLDFNLGLGYTRLDYDSFRVTDEIRVFKKQDRTRDFWGPTQAGISLVWTLGSN